MPNCRFSEEERDALLWAIGEAAKATERWLQSEEDLERAYGPAWVKRLAAEYERMKALRRLANELGFSSAAADCAVCLEEFARTTRRSVAG